MTCDEGPTKRRTDRVVVKARRERQYGENENKRQRKAGLTSIIPQRLDVVLPEGG